MDSTTSARLYFNTDMLPERDRFGAYCEEIVRRYAALDTMARTGMGKFRAAVDLQQIGPVSVGHFITAPSDYMRTPQLLRDGDDALCVVLCIEGGALQTQRGDAQALHAGEGIFCDNGQIGGLRITTDGQFWILKVQRPQIARLLPHIARFGGLKLDRDPKARQLLLGYLRTGRDAGLGEGTRTEALYGEHIVDLIALAMGVEGEAHREAEERGARVARRGAILREIERRSGDPGLNAVTVAALLGVTPRYVHLLLEETGRSFTHHVLERRLEKAATMLRDPQWCGRKIAHVAAEAGFTDLSYFNRAFRRHFGATPSDIREAASHDAAPRD